MVALATVPGRVYSRYELINRVRGYEFEGYERTVDSHVKNLRRKIADDLSDPQICRPCWAADTGSAWPAMSDVPARPGAAPAVMRSGCGWRWHSWRSRWPRCAAGRADHDFRRCGRLGPGRPAAHRADKCDRGRRRGGLGPEQQLGLRRPGAGPGPGRARRRGRAGPDQAGDTIASSPGFAARAGPAVQCRGGRPRATDWGARDPVYRIGPERRRPQAAGRAAARHCRGGRAGGLGRAGHRPGRGPPDHPAGRQADRGDPRHDGRGTFGPGRAGRARASCASWRPPSTRWPARWSGRNRSAATSSPLSP